MLRNRPSALPGDCPITWAVLAAQAASFVTMFVTAAPLWRDLAFDTAAFPVRPWTVLTYPLVASGSILWLLLGGYVFWLFGGSLERAWRGRDYAIFLVLASAVPALCAWVGGEVTGRSLALTGLGLPLSAAIVAWAAVNPYERVLVYFVIPVPARWLAVIATVLVVFSVPFPLGAFAAAGCAVAWWYARTGRYWRWGRPTSSRRRERREQDRFSLNPVALLRRWRIRRRFLRVVKGSGFKNLH